MDELVSIKKALMPTRLVSFAAYRGSWHRSDTNRDATNGAPGCTTRNKKLIGTRSYLESPKYLRKWDMSP